jgi:iron complex outermembrane receptor protein
MEFGSFGLEAYRAEMTAPLIADELIFGLTGFSAQTDGFVTDTLTGEELAYKEAKGWSALLNWRPDRNWEFLLEVHAISTHDGIGAMAPLNNVRSDPYDRFDFTRSISGADHFLHQDVMAAGLEAIHHAAKFDVVARSYAASLRIHQQFNPSVGRTFALPTYSPSFQDNREEHLLLSQAIYATSPHNAPVALTERLSLRWAAGFWIEHAMDDGRTATGLTGTFGTFFARQILEARETRLIAFARGSLELGLWLQLSGGLRWLHESGSARLRIFPATDAATASDQHVWLPEATARFRLGEDLNTFVGFAESGRPGGNNPGPPAAYRRETSRTYAVGVDNEGTTSRLRYRAGVFYTDIRHVQVQLADYTTFASFPPATQNLGDAHIRGVEFDLQYQLRPSIFLQGRARWQDSEFKANSRIFDRLFFGVPQYDNLAGLALPYVPAWEAWAGIHAETPVGRGLTLYGGVGVEWIGAYRYHPAYDAAQEAFSVVNFQVGLRRGAWYVEGYVNNAFDTNYIPYAQPTASRDTINSSGPLDAVPGRPLTTGVRMGVRF